MIEDLKQQMTCRHKQQKHWDLDENQIQPVQTKQHIKGWTRIKLTTLLIINFQVKLLLIVIEKRRSWPNNVGFLAFFEKNWGNTKDISITIRILQVYIKYFIDFERFETVAE